MSLRPDYAVVDQMVEDQLYWDFFMAIDMRPTLTALMGGEVRRHLMDVMMQDLALPPAVYRGERQ